MTTKAEKKLSICPMDERRRFDIDKQLLGIRGEINFVTHEARILTREIETLVNRRHEMLNRWRKLRDEENRLRRMAQDASGLRQREGTNG